MKSTYLPSPRDPIRRKLKKAVEGSSDSELSCLKVLAFTTNIMANTLSLEPSGDLSLEQYLSPLLFAAGRNISLHQALPMMEDAPCHRSFDRNFTPLLEDFPNTVEQINTMLAETARQVTGFIKGPVVLAMDLTELPFYGEHEGYEFVRGGKAKNGTARFFSYATLFLNCIGKRVTLAIEPYLDGQKLSEVVSNLLSRWDQFGMRVKYLLFDRQFTTAEIMSMLAEMEIPFIGAVKKNPRIKQVIEEIPYNATRIVEDFAVGKFTGQLYIRAANKAGVRGQHGREMRTFMVHGCSPSPKQVATVYRKRFGIEGSYTKMYEAKPRTSTRNGGLRLLLAGLALCLSNVWAILKYHFTAEPRDGPGRKGFVRDAFPFQCFLELLLNGIRIVMGFLLTMNLPRPAYQLHLDSLLEYWGMPASINKALGTRP